VLQYGIHTWLRTSTSSKASSAELPDLLSRITVVLPVYHHYWRTWTGLLLEIAGEIFDLPCSSRLLSATCLYKLTLFYCRLTPEPEVTTVSNSSTSSHILLSTNIRFLSEQYLSGTHYLKPASTRIPSPHFRRSSINNPERCAPPIVVIRESGLTIIELETRNEKCKQKQQKTHHKMRIPQRDVTYIVLSVYFLYYGIDVHWTRRVPLATYMHVRYDLPNSINYERFSQIGDQNHD